MQVECQFIFKQCPYSCQVFADLSLLGEFERDIIIVKCPHSSHTDTQEVVDTLQVSVAEIRQQMALAPSKDQDGVIPRVVAVL